MRILVGTYEIAGMIPVFADGFRKLGHDVTSVIQSPNPFYPHLDYDVDLAADVIRWPEAIRQSRATSLVRKKADRIARFTRLTRLITHHDVFLFQWAGTSLRWTTEFPILKRLGKQIISVFNGDDARHSSAYNQESALYYGEEAAPFVLSPDHRDRLKTDPLDRPLRNVRVAEKYSDVIFSVRCISALAVRPYLHFLVPVDLSKYKSSIPAREIPVVVHAPSNTNVKGTDFILGAIERLKSEGVRFDWRLLKGVPHQQVLPALTDADVVVDQLYFPLHGLLSLEAMATGCALASSNREDYEPFPPNRPIWHVHPGNVYSQLKRLLTDRELRLRLAHEGLSYVERYHDHVRVAHRMLEALSAGEARQYDHYPSFFAESFELPEGVTVPDDLKRMTAEIVQRWGLPHGADPNDMIRRGLMSENGLSVHEPIPRWKSNTVPPALHDNTHKISLS